MLQKCKQSQAKLVQSFRENGRGGRNKKKKRDPKQNRLTNVIRGRTCLRFSQITCTEETLPGYNGREQQNFLTDNFPGGFPSHVVNLIVPPKKTHNNVRILHFSPLVISPLGPGKPRVETCTNLIPFMHAMSGRQFSNCAMDAG